MHIAVTGHTSQRDLRSVFTLLEALSEKSESPLMVEEEFHTYLCEAGLPAFVAERTATVSRLSVPEGADLVISIGGDGTFLRAAHWVGQSLTPILGINTGRMGYLTAMMPKDISAITDAVFSKPWNVQPRLALTAEISGADIPGPLPPFALNEVALLKSDASSMISCHAAIDGITLATYSGDGLLIATPTGSTAYNLSAGGPLIQPTAPVLAISPVASHSLTMRPLVVDDSATISVSVESRCGLFSLSIDGSTVTLPSSAEVKVTRAPFPINIFIPSTSQWVDTLRQKLLWGIDPR